LRWYYDSAVWKRLAYRGVRTLKNPLDMWNYQEIIDERRIEWVVETGTRHGGSALFFGDLLAARRARPGGLGGHRPRRVAGAAARSRASAQGRQRVPRST
jgi:cephalosporin hydroxylase